MFWKNFMDRKFWWIYKKKIAIRYHIRLNYCHIEQLEVIQNLKILRPQLEKFNWFHNFQFFRFAIFGCSNVIQKCRQTANLEWMITQSTCLVRSSFPARPPPLWGYKCFEINLIFAMCNSWKGSFSSFPNFPGFFSASTKPHDSWMNGKCAAKS